MSQSPARNLRVPLVPLPEGPLAPSEGEEGLTANGDSSHQHRPTPEDLPEAGSSYPYMSDSYADRPGFARGRGCLGYFFSGRDVEGAGVHHHYTREERARLADIESIDYLPPNSSVYRRWLCRQPHRRFWDRWFLMGAIGLTVGLVGFLLFFLIEVLASVKYHVVRYLLRDWDLFVAWLFNMAYSLTLVFVSTWTVVMLAPQAAGAGVAEVMAYLNGCMLPKVFNISTLAVKFLSCACAVGSGLPVGPEGPMVHIGAMLGAALSQGHSTTLGFDTGAFKRFQNPRDKRDFVTAGTAVGIATAFGAPIGGLLFAFEELASASFRQALGWQIFFACMLSVLTLDTLRSAQSALVRGNHFGLFDGQASTIYFEVQTQLINHVAAMGPAVVIGIACGLLGIVFTLVNLKVARMRLSATLGKRWWRMAEPCLLMALFLTAGMLLPQRFPCRPTQCIVEQGGGPPVCPSNATVGRIVEPSLELYTCKVGAPDTEQPGEDGRNITVTGAYNELATLTSVTGAPCGLLAS